MPRSCGLAVLSLPAAFYEAIELDATFDSVTRLIVEHPETVRIAAGLIIVGAVLLYVVWFRPAILRLRAALDALAVTLQRGGSEGWTTTNEAAEKVLKQHPVLQEPWRETRERILTLSTEPKAVVAMLGSPRDIWNSTRLLGRNLNLSLADAVPNLFVGIGSLRDHDLTLFVRHYNQEQTNDES